MRMPRSFASKSTLSWRSVLVEMNLRTMASLNTGKESHGSSNSTMNCDIAGPVCYNSSRSVSHMVAIFLPGGRLEMMRCISSVFSYSATVKPLQNTGTGTRKLRMAARMFTWVVKTRKYNGIIGAGTVNIEDPGLAELIGDWGAHPQGAVRCHFQALKPWPELIWH